ncbi:hypothetical protein ACVBAX_12955 [Robertmurraya sp. GLU-23]
MSKAFNLSSCSKDFFCKRGNLYALTEVLKKTYRLNNDLKFISGTYKDNLIKGLEDAMNTSNFSEVEHYSELLASELVYSGWSPRSLARLSIGKEAIK